MNVATLQQQVRTLTGRACPDRQPAEVEPFFDRIVRGRPEVPVPSGTRSGLRGLGHPGAGPGGPA